MWTIVYVNYKYSYLHRRVVALNFKDPFAVEKVSSPGICSSSHHVGQYRKGLIRDPDGQIRFRSPWLFRPFFSVTICPMLFGLTFFGSLQNGYNTCHLFWHFIRISLTLFCSSSTFFTVLQNPRDCPFHKRPYGKGLKYAKVYSYHCQWNRGEISKR